MPKETTLQSLRNITLASQGLLQKSLFGKAKAGVLAAIEHLGYLQIDTLSVVERAHHHILWSRIVDYKNEYLDQLIAERQIFEYWFHAASFLPINDYRFALPQMMSVKNNDAHYYKADERVLKYVMDTIKAEGPSKVKDFEQANKQAGTWWNWKPAKVALERLFLQGDLMISSRQGMQKVYDLTERVLPSHINTLMPNALEYAEYLVLTYLRAYGFTNLKQITHLKTGKDLKQNVEAVLKELLLAHKIQKINIDGLAPLYIQAGLLDKKYKLSSLKAHILSPFDNTLIHRDRLKNVFEFDYTIECYTPQEKRLFGYFCLPILIGNTFVGRVDCKAHRKEKVLEIIHLHIENESLAMELNIEAIVNEIKRFAKFNNCDAIQLTQVSPGKYRASFKRALL